MPVRLRLTCALGALLAATAPLSAQENLVAADVVSLGDPGNDGLVPYLRGQLSRRGSPLGVPVDVSLSGWIDLRTPSLSVLNVTEATARASLGPADLRLGVGDLAWGISELRSPVDVLAPRAVLWDATRGRPLGQPVAALSLFQSWGNVDAAVFPLSRPVELGGELTETWSGRTLSSHEAWGDHPSWAVRLSRVMGPLDVALSYIHGSDRAVWGEPVGTADATLVAPPLRQLAYELQWTIGSTVAYTEAAWARRGGQEEARGTVGLEWYATPFLSLLVEQGFATERPKARIPLATDLLFGGRLYTETLRFGAQVAVDPGSGNRHYWLDARWTLDEHLAIEGEFVGWSGKATREPALALRQANAFRLSLVRYF